MPILSSTEKHEFIFKEMWGFQKRKAVVQFVAKNIFTINNNNVNDNVVNVVNGINSINKNNNQAITTIKSSSK